MRETGLPDESAKHTERSKEQWMNIVDPRFRQKGILERINHMNAQPALIIKFKSSKVSKVLWQKVFRLFSTKKLFHVMHLFRRGRIDRYFWTTSKCQKKKARKMPRPHLWMKGNNKVNTIPQTYIKQTHFSLPNTGLRRSRLGVGEWVKGWASQFGRKGLRDVF